jgi:hypothetical protein
MIPLRYIVPAVLIAAATAAYITHLVTPEANIEADRQLPSIRHDVTGFAPGAWPSMDRRAAEEEKDAAEFLRAAQAILRRAPNTRASFAASDDASPPLTGPIPLPRKRPIPRQ